MKVAFVLCLVIFAATIATSVINMTTISLTSLQHTIGASDSTIFDVGFIIEPQGGDPVDNDVAPT